MNVNKEYFEINRYIMRFSSKMRRIEVLKMINHNLEIDNTLAILKLMIQII